MRRMTTSSIRIMATGLIVLGALSFLSVWAHANTRPGKTVSFDQDWRFHLGDVGNGQDPNLDDSQWRQLNLPHDWSIEGEFDEKNPAGTGGGALPGESSGFGSCPLPTSPR